MLDSVLSGRAAIVAMALSFCVADPGRGQTLSSGAQPVTPQAGAPQPAPVSSAVALAAGGDQDQSYRIGALDTLDVMVFQVDSLSRTVVVDGNGQIDLPLIQQIQAAGKTPRELAAEIAGQFSKLGYLESPQVSVLVKESASRRFTVGGEVKSSGTFPLAGRMTLLQGIAAAGGVQSDANLKRVVVFRMAGQKRGESMVDLGKIQSGKADDPEISPGDVIVVPVSGARRNVESMASILPFLYLVALFK